MPIYRFDEVDEESLDLLPMAARRALDRAGLKLSLEAWKSLSLDRRWEVVEAGAAPVVDVDRVDRAVLGAEPAPTPLEPLDGPPADHVPTRVREALGTERDLPDALWASIGPLDRYALAKVVERGRPERIDAAYAEIIGASAVSPHLAPGGGVRMIGVGDKPVTRRRASARARVAMNEDAWQRLVRAEAPKGDVLGAARLAGVAGAKRTSELIPLCHPLALTHATVELDLDAAERHVIVVATVEAVDRTGVEMEALTSASVAALTIYDMLKAFDRTMTIGPIELIAKSGGRSGDYRR